MYTIIHSLFNKIIDWLNPMEELFCKVCMKSKKQKMDACKDFANKMYAIFVVSPKEIVHTTC